MNRRDRSNMVFGVLMILLGAWFLARQFLPDLPIWSRLDFSWQIYMIGAGVLLFVLGVVSGVPSMAVPAAIISGIGALLYWQEMTQNWGSWAYAWTLIPGFAGVGTILQGLLGDQRGKTVRQGLNMVVISLLMFAILASLLGGGQIFGQYWPVLLVILGLWMVIRVLVGKR